MAHDYKDLIVWQKAMDLVSAVYSLTRTMPEDERFGLTNQIRRAAVSVPSNIAEGQGRRSGAEFVRFLRIANGSRQELETQLLVAARLGYIDKKGCDGLLDQVAEVGRLLSGLEKSVTP
jgi:four helix bundle protein